MSTVFPPIRESRVVSFKLATPATKDANTNGTAMSFNSLTKIVPKGLMNSVVNPFQPITLDNKPQIRPKNKPITICQCNFLYHILTAE